MIFSKQLLFSDAQAVTATAASTDKIDLGATGTVLGAAAALSRDIGPGTPIPILIQAVETFATLTSLTITIETSDNADLSSSTVVYSTGAVAAASLVAGWKTPVIYIPTGVTKRYLGLRYTVGGSNATAGKITAGIVGAVQTNA
jgi:hypothetical protein